MKKPRISKPHLVWKKNRKGIWQPYHRVTWTENGKERQKTVLLRWEGKPEKLDEEYWLAQIGQHKTQQRPSNHSWSAIIEAWRADPRVQGRLSDSTKRSYRKTMDEIAEKNGAMALKDTTRQMIRQAHDARSDKPRQADKYIQVTSLLWNYAKNKRDWPIGDNPAQGIDLFGKQREFEPWPDWLVSKLPDAPLHVQIAANLILGTGQRPGAAIKMRHDDFDGDSMWVLDEKQDEKFLAFCPDELRDLVASIPKRGAHLLPVNLTNPLGYDAIEKKFRAWRNDIGDEAKKYSLHGLRKLAIIRLAEAGCSDAEIQAVTNQSAETVAYYRRKANRRRLSEAAQRRRDK